MYPITMTRSTSVFTTLLLSVAAAATGLFHTTESYEIIGTRNVLHRSLWTKSTLTSFIHNIDAKTVKISSSSLLCSTSVESNDVIDGDDVNDNTSSIKTDSNNSIMPDWSWSFQQSRRSLAIASIFGLTTLSTAQFTNRNISSSNKNFVANAATTSPSAAATTVSINVNPLAHTFAVQSSSAKPKPTRENDATRFLTNARIVFLFQGNNNNNNGATAGNDQLVNEIIQLTTKRKNDAGPGVTPGSVIQLSPPSASKNNLVDTIVQSYQKLSTTPGDVLLVGPIPTQGIVADGRLKTDTATALGTFVGTSNGGGVISVLLDGPTQNFVLFDGGYPISDLLWYSIP
jgi:septum formation inhibitor MinC